MRIPFFLRLQKHAIKNAMCEAFLSSQEAILSKGNSLIISLSLRMLLAQLPLCVPSSKLPTGACCACAAFGVCTDDDFPRNESTWVLFLDTLPILSSTQLQNCKPVAFRLYFIQSEKPTVNFRLESGVLLSFSLCRTENVAQRSKLLESHLQGALSLKIFGPGNCLLIVDPCHQKIGKSS